MLEGVSANEVAVQGIRAQRIRMNTIANNIANAQTTRTADGGPFRRQLAVFRANQLGQPLNPDNFGVKVSSIEEDSSPFRTVHDPSHPDADEDGIVLFPNVNLSVEMINLVSAQRAYEANVNVVLSSRAMHNKALEILQA